MSDIIAELERRTTPENWDGLNITNLAAEPGLAVALIDRDSLPGLAPRPVLMPRKSEFRTASKDLTNAIGEVMTGEALEVIHRAGRTFEPTTNMLPDGSLVIVEEEYLSMYAGTSHEDLKHIGTPQRLQSPHFNHWLALGLRQFDREAGFETFADEDRKIVYARSLRFGTLLTLADRSRVICTIRFSSVILDRKDRPKLVHQLDRDGVKRLPLDVGKVTVRKVEIEEGEWVPQARKVNSIEVVYATDDKGKIRRPRKRMPDGLAEKFGRASLTPGSLNLSTST
jgi:hypothetical protein